MIVTEREEIKLLQLKPSAHLASSLGYKGRSRWVQIFFEPMPVDKPVCIDNRRKVYLGSRAAWELFSLGFPFTPKCLYLCNQTNCLLLDQRYRLLYGGDKELISRLLKDPDGLKLLEPANLNKKRDYASELKELIALFSKGVSFTAGVIVATLIAAKLILIHREFKEPPPTAVVYYNNKDEVADCQHQLVEAYGLLAQEREKNPDRDSVTNRSK